MKKVLMVLILLMLISVGCSTEKTSESPHEISETTSNLDLYNLEAVRGNKYQVIDNLRGEDPPEVNVTKQKTIETNVPKWSPEQRIGADMPVLDYASDDFIVFHGNFGLFVYDLKSLEIIRSLDLEPINCHYTQGDNICKVSVSMDGNTVQLYPLSSKKMYIYNVSNNTLLETTYRPMEDPFDSQLVSGGVRFNTNEYGILQTYDWTLGTLSYVRGDRMYTLFGKEKTEATASNREEIGKIEDFDKLGITIRLPENKNWIGNPTYSIIDGTIAQVKYYDKIAETDATLRVGKADIQTLSGIYHSFDDEREEIWSGSTLDGGAINIKVQYATSDNKIVSVLVSWNYKEFNYILWGSISDKGADVSPIAKTALYIASHMR